MATTPNPLIWDFSRQIGSADGLGGVVHYYDEESQTLYLDDGNLKTKVGKVEDGHWSSSTLGNEISITTDNNFTKASFDHPINGTLYGAAIEDGKLVFLRYVYAHDLSSIVNSFKWSSQADSPIDQLSVNIQNIGSDILGDDASLFNPGAKIPVKFKIGNSELYSLGIAWVDDVDYSITNEEVSISGRNTIGYFLKDQTFDEQVVITGSSKTVTENILTRAGLTKFEVQDGSLSKTFEFEPESTFLSGLEDIADIYSTESRYASYEDYSMLEMTDGTIIVGASEWRSAKLANSRYTFNVGKDIFARTTTKNSDAAYSHIRVTGKIPTTDFSSEKTYAVGDCVVYNIPSFDDNKEYNVGDHCRYDSELFVCVIGISVGWYSGSWQLVSNEVTSEYETVAEFDERSDYAVGDYAKHDGKIYRCLWAIKRGWDSAYWNKIEDKGNVFTCTSAVVYAGEFTDNTNWAYRGNDDLTPQYLSVNTFGFWALGAHRTKHISAPYPMTQAQLNAWANKQKDALQYTGITEKFTGPFRPQLLVGDIAEIRDGETVMNLGIITDVSHSFSRSEGFRTDFTVDSGGLATDGQGYVIYSNTSRVSGYNRRQKISDLIKLISKR